LRHNVNVSFADELWLHVRCAGNWTNSLYQYFSRILDPKKAVKDADNGRRPSSRPVDISTIGTDDESNQI
jgi:hypothetical protein